MDEIKNLTPYEIADDDIVTLVASDGQEVPFVEIAGIAYKGDFYAILQPVELPLGMAEDEALVFKVTRGENDQDCFQVCVDEEIVDAVFEEYNKILEKAIASTDEE